jgi:uncharacterized integral membrane protein
LAWLTLIVTLPLTLFAVLFAVSNGQTVEASLWPLERTLSLPLSLVGLGLLFAGFLCGALFVWIHAQKTRLRLWRETRRAARIEKELDVLSRKSADAPQADPKPSDPALQISVVK